MSFIFHYITCIYFYFCKFFLLQPYLFRMIISSSKLSLSFFSNFDVIQILRTKVTYTHVYFTISLFSWFSVCRTFSMWFSVTRFQCQCMASHEDHTNVLWQRVRKITHCDFLNEDSTSFRGNGFFYVFYTENTLFRKWRQNVLKKSCFKQDGKCLNKNIYINLSYIGNNELCYGDKHKNVWYYSTNTRQHPLIGILYFYNHIEERVQQSRKNPI